MTVDLDREILDIKYNILNLPDKVTFKSGDIIVNLYDASGKKLSSGYLTKTSNDPCSAEAPASVVAKHKALALYKSESMLRLRLLLQP